MTHLQHAQHPVRDVLVSSAIALLGLAITLPSQAAVPGILGPTFNLAAGPSTATMPDGAQVYTWNYGCGIGPTNAGPGIAPAVVAPTALVPSTIAATSKPNCPVGQLPGPTLIVTEGQTVTVNLYNGLPAVAGNTSIVFSGFAPTAVLKGTTTVAPKGLVASEAAPGKTITYTFTANKPGTYAYYSGTRPELQIEMGLYGAIVVLPANPYGTVPATGSTSAKSAGACAAANPGLRNLSAQQVGGTDYRLSSSAYDHALTCYDREFLFQFHEMDSNIHAAVEAAVQACGPTKTTCPPLSVATDPYHPNYFMVNGRSFPDDADPNYTPLYPNQPYNGDPLMHPGESVLLRVIGQGRWQHPFHIHANHGRILARDGNLLISATNPNALAGPLYYTLPTVSGQAQDVLFTYTAKGLNWDVYGHSLTSWAQANVSKPGGVGPTPVGNPLKDPTPCYPDANGYYTTQSSPPAPTGAKGTQLASNYFEWCADHNKPIPVTPPDPQIVANGLWYGGTPYLGLTTIPLGGGAPQFLSTPLPPGTNIQNPNAGYAFMWHSHAERELTSNDVFPGGMLMMLVVLPPIVPIDESL